MQIAIIFDLNGPFAAALPQRMHARNVAAIADNVFCDFVCL